MRRFSHPPIPPSPLPSEAATPSEAAYLTKQQSRRLRRDSSVPEQVLWGHLRNRKLADLKFRRQHPLGPFTVDFFCEEAKLAVELDSSWHDGRKEEDKARDAWMIERGIQVVRVTASNLTTNPDAVLRTIEAAAVRAISIQIENPSTRGDSKPTEKK